MSEDRCTSCDRVHWTSTRAPYFVVRSHVADDRPIFVRLCVDCLERTIKGGALVEQDVVGRIPTRMYEEICRRLGSCPPVTRHYERLREARERCAVESLP